MFFVVMYGGPSLSVITRNKHGSWWTHDNRECWVVQFLRDSGFMHFINEHQVRIVKFRQQKGRMADELNLSHFIDNRRDCLASVIRFDNPCCIQRNDGFMVHFTGSTGTPVDIAGSFTAWANLLTSRAYDLAIRFTGSSGSTAGMAAVPNFDALYLRFESVMLMSMQLGIVSLIGINSRCNWFRAILVTSCFLPVSAVERPRERSRSRSQLRSLLSLWRRKDKGFGLSTRQKRHQRMWILVRAIVTGRTNGYPCNFPKPWRWLPSHVPVPSWIQIVFTEEYYVSLPQLPISMQHAWWGTRWQLSIIPPQHPFVARGRELLEPIARGPHYTVVGSHRALFREMMKDLFLLIAGEALTHTGYIETVDTFLLLLQISATCSTAYSSRNMWLQAILLAMHVVPSGANCACSYKTHDSNAFRNADNVCQISLGAFLDSHIDADFWSQYFPFIPCYQWTCSKDPVGGSTLCFIQHWQALFGCPTPPSDMQSEWISCYRSITRCWHGEISLLHAFEHPTSHVCPSIGDHECGDLYYNNVILSSPAEAWVIFPMADTFLMTFCTVKVLQAFLHLCFL